MSNNNNAFNDNALTGPGDLIAGRYRIDSVIGVGGMATVFRAQDEELGRTVALKIFRTDVVDAASVRRQAEEIRLLASLDHPALVTLYDVVSAVVDDPSSRGVLVMQYIEGQDLRGRLMAGGPLPGAIAAEIGADIAAALAYVHAAGVIHRDISPANVLLPTVQTGGAPMARLADFGIARLVDSASLTVSGTVIGTATYLSPEQARGDQLSPASDIYSLGLVLLESLTGERAFPGTAVESAIARLAGDPVIPDDLSPAWRETLTAMTAREPRERPDAAAVATRLQALPAAPAGTLLLPAAMAATQVLPTSGDAATQVLPTADATTRVLPSADAATAVLPTATAVLPTAGSAERTESVSSMDSPTRPNRAVIVLAVLVAALLVVVGVFALTGLGDDPVDTAPAETPTAAAPVEEAPVEETPVEETPQPPAAPDYPAIDGPLGDALRALQESVAGVENEGLRSAVLAISDSAAAADYESALDQLDSFINDVGDDDLLSDRDTETIRAATDRVERELESAQKAAEKDNRPGNGNGNGNED